MTVIHPPTLRLFVKKPKTTCNTIYLYQCYHTGMVGNRGRNAINHVALKPTNAWKCLIER